jgi:hypothetical protein
MEYTVNQQNIHNYAEQLTAELCKQFFVNKAFISGPEILAFNSENQLNLLIVKNIFLNWQKETLKLKSPYFDFEDEGVKLALKTFMNKLSNHIKVYRYDFEPLVKKSISDFILLSAAPAEFFTAEIEALASPKMALTMLKDFARYIRVNRFVIDQVVREIEASGYTETFGGETIRFMRKAIHENPDKLESAEKVLEGLLAQQAAKITDFVCSPKPMVTPPAFLDTPRPEAWATTEYVPISQPENLQAEEPVAVRDDSKFLVPDLESESETESDPSPAEEYSVNPEMEPEIQPIQSPIEETQVVNLVELDSEPEASTDTTFENKNEPENQDEAFNRPFHETIKSSKSEISDLSRETVTLNDSLRNLEKTGITEAIQSRTVAAPFKTLVPMHYRFTFINSLFDGNQEAWAEAVERIDSTSAFEEAVTLLRSEYATRFKWEEKEDNVSILFNYVERKF